MASKFVIVNAFLLAVASAVPLELEHGGYGIAHAPAYIKSYAAPAAVVKTVAAAPIYKQLEYEAPPEYEFSYGVHDPHTGDVKSQQESRKGDVVHGRYEVIEPDGHKRIVEYTADDHNGFNAIVHREPTDIKIPVPIVAQKVIAAPVAYAAPAVAKYAYAAPVATKVIASAPAISYHGLGGLGAAGYYHH